MGDKMITEVSLTPEEKESILTYAQAAMRNKQNPNQGDRNLMAELAAKLNMSHGEIIALASTLAK